MNSQATATTAHPLLKIAAGLAGMWLFGSIGIHLLHQFHAQHFVFIDRLDEAGKNVLIIKHYLLLFIVQAPAIYWGGWWFNAARQARSGFNVFVLVLGLQAVLLVARSFNWPWVSFTHVNQSVPLIVELVYIFAIAASTASLTSIIRPRSTLAQTEMRA